MYRTHVHTEHGNTWTYGFSNTLPSVTMSGDAHTLCVPSHSDTCRSDRCPLSDPRWHRPSRTAILICSVVIILLRRPLLLVTIALLETHALVFWHCLHPCGPRALSPFKFAQQSTSFLLDWWAKIFVVYVILFVCHTIQEINSNGFDR